LESFALQSSYPSLSLQVTSSSSGGRTHGAATAQPTTTQRSNSKGHTNLSQPDQSEQLQNGGFQKKIILLRDPPAHDDNYSNSDRLQNMYNFILSFQCPVVMVLSDVSGRDDMQYATDRCLPRHIRQR
jgi:hypothetical protein